MAKGGIKLSPKHGLNPSMSVCFFCGEEKNEIILPGKLNGDAEALRKAVWNKIPCDKCEEYMRQGIIFIGVDERLTTDRSNPYRTGKFAVIKDEAVKRIIADKKLVDNILRQRVAFAPNELWDLLGITCPEK
jgi:hypothetical protein